MELFCMTFRTVPESITFAPKSANFMPEGANFKKECKKVLFNNFAVMQFSLLDQLFFPVKKLKFCCIFLVPILIPS